jgi:hypothetical protein
MISDPGMAVKLKRGQKEKIESALSDAMAQLEIEDTGAEELRKKVRPDIKPIQLLFLIQNRSSH